MKSHLISTLLAIGGGAASLLLMYSLVTKPRLSSKNCFKQQKKSKEASFVEVTQVVFPDSADSSGVSYSGAIMAWIDVCAGIAVKSHANMPCVTASIDAVHFLRPIHAGDIVVLRASVNRTWRTSMEVGVGVVTENTHTGEKKYCCHAYLTFVALKNGSPFPVPELIPREQEELKEWNAADDRRKTRFHLRSAEAGMSSDEYSKLVTEESSARPKLLETETLIADTDNQHYIHTTASYTQNTVLIMPQHANSIGITFGGHIIKLMEECALVAASRHTSIFSRKHGANFVFRAASLDCLNFRNATKIGDIITIRSYVSRVWKSSIEVYITVHARSIGYNDDFSCKTADINSCTNDKMIFTNDGYMTFIAVEKGLPLKLIEEDVSPISSSFSNQSVQEETLRKVTQLPQVIPVTQLEKLRFESAQKRRDSRLQEKARFISLLKSNGTMNISVPVGSEVTQISFSFVSSADVKKLSVKALNNPQTFDPITNIPISGGLYDPVLGPFDKNETCATCKLNSFACPGHFGHIELAVPVYHPLLFKHLFGILKATCLCCHSFKMAQTKVYRYEQRLHLARAGLVRESMELGSIDLREISIESLGSEDSTPLKLIDVFVSESFRAHGIDPVKVKYVEPVSLSHNYIRLLVKEILQVAANVKMCENCGGKSPTLRRETHTKIFRSPLSARDKSRNVAKGVDQRYVFGIDEEEAAKQDQRDEDDNDEIEDEIKKSKSIYMTPIEVKEHIRLAWENNIGFLDHLFGSIVGKKTGKRKSNFEIFFMNTIPVPPTRFRPISFFNDQQYDHPQNTFLLDIIKNNNAIISFSSKEKSGTGKDKEKPHSSNVSNDKHEISPDMTFRNVITSWVSLQESVNNMHDSTKNPKTKNMPSGIKQIMEKKEGLFRKHMMGKRVNYAARSVISPDPNIETSEIGIPMVFAKKLTFPEPVTQYNINEMRQVVINGPDKYPGALSVQNEDGSLTSLQHCTIEQRTAIANQLLTPPSNFKASEDVAYINKKIHRHLKNGDMLLLNRQPTLHKPSIMGHVARILPGEKTIRMHYANCNTYNADFDGDEMNVHFPQTPLAQAEARLIMNTNNQYLVPTSGEPLRGLIQDHVVTGVLMTSRDTFFSREDYSELIYAALPDTGKRIITVPPAIVKPFPMWTGKQVVSTVLKNLTLGYKPLCLDSKSQVPGKSWSILQKVDTEEGNVKILDGDLLTGILDKKQFGAKPYGLVHACFEVYGPDIAGKLLTTLGRLFTKYVQYIGFSCRMDDLVVLAEADNMRKAKIAGVLKQGRDILKEFAFGESGASIAPETSVEKQLSAMIKSSETKEEDKHRAMKALAILEDKKLFKALEETIRSDEKLAALDNKMKSRTGAVTTGIVKDMIPNGLFKPFPENGMQLMTVSGAKGSNVNVTQISCMLGQQELEGRRVPVMVSGKTLPSFRAYDLGPRAGGYITGRFLTGIRPQEYYFHCMAGREGLVDTAVKTARSGYLQRCLIKHMEGLKVNYDCTVRESSDGSVYQFHYGEDSLDVTKSSYLNKFSFNAQNYEAFLEKYNPHSAVKALDTQKATKHARKAYKKPHIYDPTLSKYHPGRFLGAVSDKFYSDLQKYISSDPHHLLAGTGKGDKDLSDKKKPVPETFEALMQLKYINSLIEPGEAVGLLAAQSIGEPSTQMTLNTFHFAGHGAKNVTLGIPRLREIIMTASTKPKTPQMTVPFKKEISKAVAETICLKISRLTLGMIVEDSSVVEKFLPKSASRDLSRSRSYRIRLNFCKKSVYESEYGLSQESLVKVVTIQFVKKLINSVMKDLKNSKKTANNESEEIGKGQDVNRFHETLSGPADEDEDMPKKSSRKEQKSIVSDDEGDGMDIDATSASRAAKKKQQSSYDGPDDDDNEILKNMVATDDENDDIVGNILNGELRDEILGDNQLVTDLYFDSKGEYCELELQFPSDTKKILMVTHVEKVAPTCIISEVPGIAKCFLSEDKQSGDLIMTTDGVSISGLWDYDDFFDLVRMESNDIAGILKHYGVEAARKTIIREISGVFAVYGIEVDTRHLTLIADYMTFEGGYKPFNRIGIESCVSPFAKMTFETTFHFLTEATTRGDYDNLTSPSARIVMGRLVEGGTGAFEVVQPII